MNDLQITKVESVDVVEAKERAAYDIQIATAKRYPRDVQRAKDNSIAIATMDKETAESCGYALPRGSKTIQGPSVHLAKILAQNWGNIRIEAKVVDITSKEIVSSAICFDLENNIAVKVEVRRKITDRYGATFNQDMITVTGNAANSIALRNAVFAVIPEQVTKAVYNSAMNMIAGDLSSEEKLIKSRESAIKYFKDTYAITEQEILKAIGVGTVNAIKRDQIILLGNMKQALVDGDSTVNEMFQRNKKKDPIDKKQALKNKETQSKIEMP